MQTLMSTTSSDGTTSVALKQLDADLLERVQRQKKRAKRADVSAEDDLLVGDIHYRPVVLLLFLVVAFIGSMWVAYATPYGLHALVFSRLCHRSGGVDAPSCQHHWIALARCRRC